MRTRRVRRSIDGRALCVLRAVRSQRRDAMRVLRAAFWMHASMRELRASQQESAIFEDFLESRSGELHCDD
jgi:hypothetical protein